MTWCLGDNDFMFETSYEREKKAIYLHTLTFFSADQLLKVQPFQANKRSCNKINIIK